MFNIATEVLEDKLLTASTQLEHSLLSKDKLDPTKVSSTAECNVHSTVLSTKKTQSNASNIFMQLFFK